LNINYLSMHHICSMPVFLKVWMIVGLYPREWEYTSECFVCMFEFSFLLVSSRPLLTEVGRALYGYRVHCISLSTKHLHLSPSPLLNWALRLDNDSLWTPVNYRHGRAISILWLDRPLKHIAELNSFLLKGPLQFVCSKWKRQKEHVIVEYVTRRQAGLSVGSSQAHTNKYYFFLDLYEGASWY